MNVTMEMLVNYCKQYGYIFQGSEIYGGLSNTWDYGSLGVELKNNVRKMWWKKFIQENPEGIPGTKTIQPFYDQCPAGNLLYLPSQKP